jgi:hypothetical protein
LRRDGRIGRADNATRRRMRSLLRKSVIFFENIWVKEIALKTADGAIFEKRGYRTPAVLQNSRFLRDPECVWIDH